MGYEQREGELVADALLRLRRQTRDTALQRLSHERDSLFAAARLDGKVLALLVDHALLDARWIGSSASARLETEDDLKGHTYRTIIV